MRVSACVINWNGGRALGGALDSLVGQTHADLAVTVIDNASRDGSAALAREREVRLVGNLTNRGYAGAANQAVELATRDGADVLLVCNPDVRLEPDYLTSALAALDDAPRRAGVQGKLLRFSPGTAPGSGPAIIDTTGHRAFVTRLFRNRGEGLRDDGSFDTPGAVFGVSGAVAVYRLAALHDVACAGEVFDEELFAFWEDVDLDWRFALRGWHAWYAPDAVGWHERGGAGPRRSPTVERLNFVNRFRVIAKNDDPAALLRAAPGFAVTTALKAGELAVTVPSAFLRALPDLAALPGVRARRRLVQSRATVDPAAVVARWFEPFDYAAWMRTWWRRVRAEHRR